MTMVNTHLLDSIQENSNDKTIKKSSSLGTRLFFGLTFFSIAFGWVYRDELYLSAEEGLGYNLGIIGGVFMLVLLLYPLRKKIRWLSRLGAIKHWFRIHMALGIIGPTLILYHSSFSLGSVNSNVALFCMIIVAASGLVGRFIYTRIHYDLYGEKMSLAELKDSLQVTKQKIGSQFSSLPEIENQLQTLEQAAYKRRNFIMQFIWIPVLVVMTNIRRRRIKRILKSDIRKTHGKLSHDDMQVFRQSLRAIYNYIETTKRLGQLNTYERLFSIWHIVHLPLFFMLIITGIIHVIAVHMY